jgi:hypothetical protein
MSKQNSKQVETNKLAEERRQVAERLGYLVAREWLRTNRKETAGISSPERLPAAPETQK